MLFKITVLRFRHSSTFYTFKLKLSKSKQRAQDLFLILKLYLLERTILS